MSASVKTDVFISYAWEARKQAVYRMVDAIRQANFTLWLDVEKMAGSVQKAMTQGIDAAKVVLLFYSEPYFKSANCKIEAEHAQKSGKTIIIVSMQKNFTPKEWLANILKGRQKPIDFSDETNFWQVANEIVTKLQAAMKLPSQPLRPRLMKAINIPKSYCNYFDRHVEQKNLQSAIYRLCTSRRTAAVAVKGMAGVGKSTLIQNFLSNDEEFLAGRCGIHYVAWMNVIHHRPDKPYNEEGFVKDLCDLLTAAGIQFDRAEIGIQLSKIGQLIDQYMPCRSDTFLLVLDDVFDVNVLETMINKIQSANVRIIAISRDQDRLSPFVSSDHFVDIGLLGENDIRQILRNNLKVKLPGKTLNWFAGHCHGLLIVVSLVCVHLSQLTATDEKKTKQIVDELMFDLEEQPGDMHVNAADRTLTRLMQRNLAMEVADFAECYKAILFFDPGTAVEIGDIAVMWQSDDVVKAEKVCLLFCRKSLLTHAGKTAATGQVRFCVHELLRDAGVRFVCGKNRTKTFLDLQNFQSRFVTPGVLRRCVDNKRHALLLHIIAHCNPERLAEICENQTDFGPNRNRKTFMQYLYESGQTAWRESLGEGVDSSVLTYLAEDSSLTALFGSQEGVDLKTIGEKMITSFRTDQNMSYADMPLNAEAFNSFISNPSGETFFSTMLQDTKMMGGFKTEKNVAMDLLFRLVRRLLGSHVDVIRLMNLQDASGNSTIKLILEDQEDKTIETDLMKYLLMRIESQLTGRKENATFYRLPVEPEDLRIKRAIGELFDINDKRKELYYLTASGDFYQIESYLKQQPDAESCYKMASEHDQYDSPLQLAAANSLAEICRLLWAKCSGAIDQRDLSAALIKAVERGHYETTEFLIKIGADVNAGTGETDESVVFLAARYGYLDIIKLLKASGADLGKRNQFGVTATTIATLFGRNDVADFLQASGVNAVVMNTRMVKETTSKLLHDFGLDHYDFDESDGEAEDVMLSDYLEWKQGNK